MSHEDRVLDLRDSTVQNALMMTRKGRSDADAAFSQLSRDHCTPWGEAVGPDGNNDAPVVDPTLRSNHFQNTQSNIAAGTYRVPDMSPAHNHFQNGQTDQRNGKKKMSSSRINEGIEMFSPAPRTQPGECSPMPRGKVATGTSRINHGNDIFGGPTQPIEGSRPRPQPTEDFVDRPPSGHVRGNQWLGYTNAQSRPLNARTGSSSTSPW
jgi:hypothetical protein